METPDAEEDGSASIDVDLVVTDVVMPGKSGIELGRIVTERYPDLPVLLISGNLSDGALTESAAKDGESSFLGKPFTPDQLVPGPTAPDGPGGSPPFRQLTKLCSSRDHGKGLRGPSWSKSAGTSGHGSKR